jgi:DNA (cytosine-5)-methyltransferase 1
MLLNDDFTYIDLFAGIGGFHCAMDKVSNGKAKCLFASEIDDDAAKTYKLNFPETTVYGDIRKITKEQCKQVDVICGGFPCQTFSKAGKQDGFKDPRGTLFKEIIRIINYFPDDKKPKILILENVRNLVSHDNGDTWKTIRNEIEKSGYTIADKPYVVAPKDFGIPQLRDRAVILAVRKDIYCGNIDFAVERRPHNNCCITSILETGLSKNDKKKYAISSYEKRALNCWNDFMQHMKIKTIGFPIWSDEFGKDYDISDLPDWKQKFIRDNRKLYSENKDFIDSWLAKWDIRQTFTPTNRKFEWQASTYIDNIYDGIIQFRTSGIRVKRLTESPALVAMVHLPIIGPEKRFITPREAARLQSFPECYKFNEGDFLIYKQLGNAVNVSVISEMFKMFVHFLNKRIKGEKYGKDR